MLFLLNAGTPLLFKKKKNETVLPSTSKCKLHIFFFSCQLNSIYREKPLYDYWITKNVTKLLFKKKFDFLFHMRIITARYDPCALFENLRSWPRLSFHFRNKFRVSRKDKLSMEEGADKHQCINYLLCSLSIITSYFELRIIYFVKILDY